MTNPIQKHNEALDQIERLMDAWQVGGLLDLMAEVASAKADHIRENWQDEITARTWDEIATRLIMLQHSIMNRRAPKPIDGRAQPTDEQMKDGSWLK